MEDAAAAAVLPDAAPVPAAAVPAAAEDATGAETTGAPAAAPAPATSSDRKVEEGAEGSSGGAAPVAGPCTGEEGTQFDASDPPTWPLTMQHIANRLYFSGLKGATDEAQLRANKITRVLTLLSKPEEAFPDIAQYHCVPVKDSQEESGPVMEAGLPEGIAWVDECIRAGHNVLIHCSSGISRSGTAVLAYLMKYRGMSLKDAWRHVSDRRRVVLPNDTFFRLLQKLECAWRGVAESTVSKADYGAWNLRAITSVDLSFEQAASCVQRAGGDLNEAYMLAITNSF